jgi:hypothetical protein
VEAVANVTSHLPARMTGNLPNNVTTVAMREDAASRRDIRVKQSA